MKIYSSNPSSVPGSDPRSQREPAGDSHSESAGNEYFKSFPRFAHADYAWALNKLRRAGATPTLAAIAREIAQRDAEQGLPEPMQVAPPVLRPKASDGFQQEEWKTQYKQEIEARLQEEFSHTIFSLRERLDHEKLHREHLEKRLADAIENRHAVEELEQELKQAREAESLARQNESALRSELESLSREAANAREELLLRERGGESEIQAVRKAEADARARIEELEQQLEESQVDAVLAASLENLIHEQKLSLESTGLRVEALTEKLREASAKASRVDGLESEIIALQAEADAWQERERRWREDLSVESSARNQLQQQLEELGHAREKTVAELEEAQAELLRLQALESESTSGSDQAFSHEEAVRIQNEIEAVRETARRAEESLEEMRGQSAQLQKELEESKAALEQSRGELDAARGRGVVLEAELQASRERMEQAEAHHHSQIQSLEQQLAESRGNLERIEARRSDLEARVSTLEEEKSAAESQFLQSQQERAAAVSLAESRQQEIDTLRTESQKLDAEISELRTQETALRENLESHEKEISELRSTLADTEARLQDKEEAQPEEEHAEELRRQLDEHRDALTDARSQNQRLLERLEGTVKAIAETSRPRLRLQLVRPVLSAIIFLAVVGAAGFGVWKWAPHWVPSVEEMRASQETFDRLNEQNSALAAELNETLERLRGAKHEEVTHAEIRALRERLLTAEAAVTEYQRESTANLARMTQLQSDLDLARSRLERISAELTARDLKILELERLLGEAGAAVLELPAPPRLSLSAPHFEATLPGMPGLPDIHSYSSELGDTVSDSLRTLQHQAEEAWRAKNFGLAEVLFQRLAEAAPTNSLALSNLAAVQLELGKLSLARENIRRAIALEPNDAFSHTTLGMVLLRSGDSEAAQEALLQAIELDPSAPDAYHYLGVAFDQQGHRLRAIEEVEKAVALSPTYSEAHFNLAVLHSQGGPEEREKARSHYQKALDLGASPSHELDALLR